MKHWKPAAVIFLLAYAVSWSLRYNHFSPPELNRYGFGSDADTYWDLSGNLLSGRGYISSPAMHPIVRGPDAPWLPNISTAPGYPVLLWLARSFWNNLTAAYVLQALLYFGIVMVFAAWCPFFSLGLITCVAFWPGFLIYSQGIDSDLAAAFFAVLLVWGLERSLDASRWVGFTASVSAVLGAVMLTLTRSNALFFIVPLVLGRLALRRPATPNPRLLWSILLSVALAYGVWSYRNFRWSGSMVFSAYAGQVLYVHYPPHDPSLTSGASREAFVRDRVMAGDSWPAAERALYAELSRQVRREVIAHPLLAVASYTRAFTGLFVDAYFRLPDLLWARIYDLRLVDNRKVDVRDPRLSRVAAGMYIVARIADLGLRLSAGILFLLFPFVSRTGAKHSGQTLLWWSVFMFIAGTAIVANSGERLQLPVTVFILTFAWQTLRGLRDGIVLSRDQRARAMSSEA